MASTMAGCVPLVSFLRNCGGWRIFVGNDLEDRMMTGDGGGANPLKSVRIRTLFSGFAPLLALIFIWRPPKRHTFSCNICFRSYKYPVTS